MGGVILVGREQRLSSKILRYFVRILTKSNFQSADFLTGRVFCPEIDSVCAINTKNGQGYFL